MKKKCTAALLAAALAAMLACPALAAPMTAKSAARVGAPVGLLLQADGTLLAADKKQNLVLSVKDGAVTTLAGTAGAPDVNGDPAGGYADGKAAEALFTTPWAIAPFQKGYAVTDSDNHAVRYIADGVVRTIAGSGEAGFMNLKGNSGRFNYPTGLAADGGGSLYVADTGNSVIRKIAADGTVSTWADTSLGLSEPTGLCWSDGALYVADTGNNRVVAIKSGVLTVLAGAAGENDYVDGTAASARLSAPQGVAVGADGTVYIADTGNSAVRALKDGRVSTLYRLADDPADSCPVAPTGLAVSGSTLYVSDPFSGTIFTLTAAAPAVFTDVAAGDWFAPAVAYAADNGLFRGVTATSFAPQGTMDRAMFATILSRLETRTWPNTIVAGSSSFSDVAADAWYAGAVSWCADSGLVTGDGGGRFAPARAISRQELTVLLWRYAKYRGLDVTDDGGAALAKLTDAGDTAAWAKDAVSWAVAANILQGSGGKLMPTASATRAQTAQLLKNYLVWAEK